MKRKICPCRFTLKFNEQNYQERYVAELLNGLGRKKATYITSAILHFMTCTKTLDIEQSQDTAMQQKIELMVKMAMEKYTPLGQNETIAPVPQEFPKRRHTTIIEQPSSVLTEEEIEAIGAALQSFNN